MKKILIIGGGFAGATTAFKLSKVLKKPDYEICLVSKSPDFSYYPSIFHALSGYTPESMAWPLETMFAGTGVAIDTATITNIDFSHNVAQTEDGLNIRFDYCVVATGSEVVYYDMQDIKSKLYTIDSMSSILRLRSALICATKAQKQTCVSVVGAGPTGAETAGEIAHTAAQIASELGVKNCISVVLHCARSRITEQFSEKTSQVIEAKLTQLGVEIKYNSKLTHDYLASQSDDCQITVWCAGFKACRLDKIISAIFTPSCKLVVNEHLQISDVAGNTVPHVFAAGDVADTPLSGLAQTAQRHAGCVARNIINQEKNIPLEQNSDITLGYVLTMGPDWGVYARGRITISGGFMATFKRLIDFKSYMHMMPLRTAFATLNSFKYKWQKPL